MNGEQLTKQQSKIKAATLTVGQWITGLGWWRVTLIVVGLVAIYVIGVQRQKRIDAELMGSVSFDKMWESLAEIQSVQYTEVETFPDEPDTDVYRRRVSIQGKHLKRSEFSLDKSFFERAENSVRSQLRGFGKYSGPSVSIDNAATGKHVSLAPDEKRFVEYTHQVIKDLSGKLISKTEIKPNSETDHIKSFLSRFVREAKLVGVETIAGKRAVGFASERPSHGDRRFDLYWIDPQTQLPLNIESHFFDAKTGVESRCYLFSDFVFDVELDESLFDTTAPAGYKVEQDVIEGMIATPQPVAESEAELVQ